MKCPNSSFWVRQVDIYSYGVLLWELSAGEAPPGRSLRPLR